MEQVLCCIESEYEVEDAYLKDILTRCGIEEEHLSMVNGQLYLRVLSESARLLQLKDTKTSSYLLALTDLEDSAKTAEEEASELQLELEQESIQQKQAEAELQRLYEIRQRLKDAVIEREENEHGMTIEQRCRDNENQQEQLEHEVKALEDDLQRNGYFTQILDQKEHTCLSQLADECAAIEKKNDDLSLQLSTYYNLPIDHDSANAQLRQAREKLEELELLFRQEIQQML